MTGGTGNDQVTLTAALSTVSLALSGGFDTLILANVANTGSVSNIESVTGNAADDAITLATAVSQGVFNLAGGTDTLIFGNFTNNAVVSNVETLTGGSGADTVTLGTALSGSMAVNLFGGVDTLNLGNFTNTGTIAGVEKLNGGTGNETITYSGSITGAVISLGTGTDSVTLGGTLNTVRVVAVETVTGSAGSDSVTNGGSGAVTFTGSGGFDTYVGGTGVDTVVLDHAGISDVVQIKSFRVSGADKIALDVAAVATNGVDAFDIGGATLVANTNIKSIANDGNVAATVLSNGGSGGFVYAQDTGNLYYDADGDFSSGSTLIATVLAGGTTPWTYDIAGFSLV